MRIEKWIAVGTVIGLSLALGLSYTEAKVEELVMTVVTLTNPAAAGEKAMLTIKTEVGAMCLGNRYSESNSGDRGKLALKNVDREGGASWSWPIVQKSTKGRWVLTLQCSTGKKKGRLRQTFEIR